MIITLMADRYGYLAAVEEVKEEWISDLLAFLGFNLQELNDMDPSEVTDYLFQNKLDIVNYPGIGAVSIEYEGEIVGEWAGPELTLKEDRDGKLYYEIDIECWSIMEEDIDLSS